MTRSQRQIDADQTKTATNIHPTGTIMANIRSVNRRHKRAIVAQHARNKAAETPAIINVEPVQAPR